MGIKPAFGWIHQDYRQDIAKEKGDIVWILGLLPPGKKADLPEICPKSYS
jgi:hypothetical protein